MKKDFYTIRDIAEELQVQERAIRRLVSKGELKVSRVLGKFVVTAENYKAFIDSNEAGDVRGDEEK